MVWAAFSSVGKLELQFVSNKMKSIDYIDVLKLSLLPYLRKFRRLKLVFQQDNARIHVSRESNEWFKAEKINVLDWPACSPDLNPMENLWAIMVRNIYDGNRQYDTVENLKTAIKDAWSRITSDTINNLCQSLNTRIFQVINRSGSMTDY